MCRQSHVPQAEKLAITGDYHPLGPGHPLILLEKASKNAQGLRAQLVKLPGGWVYLIPELQMVEGDRLRTRKAQVVEPVDTLCAREIAAEDGQEELFLLITQLDATH